MTVCFQNFKAVWIGTLTYDEYTIDLMFPDPDISYPQA